MRLTPTGLVALVGSGALTAAALLLSSVTLAVCGVALATALALAARTTPPRAQASRRVSAQTRREGEAIRVELDVRASGPVRVVDAPPPGTSHVGGETVGSGARVSLAYEIVAGAPGALRFPPVRVTTGDRLGLVEHVVHVDAPADVLVLPRVDEIPRAAFASRRFVPTGGRHLVGQAGSGSEFFALREYQQGDTMRDVNWRASARTGSKLVVNQREMESQGSVFFFLDSRRVAAFGTWERNGWADGVRATASLAVMVARARDRPSVLPYGPADATPILARAADPGLTGLLTDLARTDPSGATTARAAVEAALPRLARRSAAVIVSSLLDDATVAEAVGALGALEIRTTVIALDGCAYLALAGADEAHLERARTSRRAMLAALQAQGADVIEVGIDEALPLALARSVPA